ncbi:winged helix-turn-helix transcriptional regulator [Actinoplanes teichomyceticus]|uniref:HxlR family transcriptional regulator n=1 Tax=Actinoplanes teichomyceticus TaxID=1867 RepID=A0A561VM63_ACTTI|nr:helix-turn-helix domain-containing protein [Actinoplanes teichomyceticus]TWG12721.1 HxlR family transcriptional regulator [Actinoplanes teichomyceticus]GIF13454.1 HxlR family transcriptional regulator [Actinoplanes teichomyceticus]
MSQRIDPANCSVARALAVVGERWSLLIVREALDGARRFDEFQTRLGIARNLLSTRLDTLVAAGVLHRVPYRDPGNRRRFEYRLTERGQALRPTLIALLQWADDHLPTPEGPSVVVRHRPDCEEPVRVVLECAAGHSHLPPEAVHRAPGPGARYLNA